MLVSFDRAQQPINEVATFRDDQGTYMSIESGISVKIKPKYCDFTSFNNKYVSKTTGIRYTELEQYRLIEKMSESQSRICELLAYRRVVPVIK